MSMREKIWNEILPNALAIGVSYDLFWTLNPKKLAPFTKAFTLKQQYDDYFAWQQGVYIRHAIGSCIDAKVKYPEQPYSKKGEVENKVMSPKEIKARMMARVALINSTFRKENNE